jgi:Holliday junction resolvasome RuvABC DNA-binding subunit
VLQSSTSLLEESFKTELDQALRSLGYAPKEIEQVINKNVTALAETTSVEQALKLILRNL